MGPGGQREESELTCGPGLSARGRERLRGDAGAGRREPKGRRACAGPRDWAAGAGVGRAAGRWAARKGWVGPSAGKGEGVGLGPVVGVWAGFSFPFLFYFFPLFYS